MIDSALLAESRALLGRALLIAEAPAARSGEMIGRGHPTSAMPPGAFTYSTSTLQACGERINRAIANDSDVALRAANEWATRELDALQHAPAVGAESAIEFGDRVVREHSGELAGVVARAEMSSVTTIRKLRAERGCDPRTGHKLAGNGGPR